MEEDLLEISDGKLYGTNDMVKVGCHDCQGCSSCCQGMGDSIWLDPYDIFQLTRNLNKTFQELLAKEVELHVEDGLVLPNIKMQGEEHSSCSFLDKDGRCSIHSFRPGLCRLFPLGRNYEEDKLTYFLLVHECPAKNKTKMKVNKWLGVPRIKDYEDFLVAWHNLTKGLRSYLMENAQDEAVTKALNLKFLGIFYMTPFQGEDFYLEFKVRLENWQNL